MPDLGATGRPKNEAAATEMRVLVVDDEPKIRRSVVRALTGARLPVIADAPTEVFLTTIEAESGEGALELVETEKPDLLFLDLMMPGMSGLDVLERLGEGRDMLAVLITAFASIETAVAATKRGAWDVLAKPFAPDDVRAVARKGASHLVARRRAAALSRERHRVRYQFISQIAHELNGAIQVILGNIQVIDGRTHGDELGRYGKEVRKILDRSKAMKKLVDDIGDLTRIEAGEKVRAFEEVSLEEVALGVIEDLALQADERGITVALDAGDDPVIRADRTDVECILGNLVSNAVKYNREGGRVGVRLAGTESGAVITVEDTGIGIAAEDLARVGDEFFRVTSDEVRRIAGSGLGLSIVKRTAGVYGGEVTVESTPGVGTRVRVSLESQHMLADPVERATPPAVVGV